MPSVPARPIVGTVLSRRWRLVQKLGDGGMGEVFAAEPISSGGPRVAVKLLRAEFVDDPHVRARFADEGRTCMRLVHPNIVRVLECATTDDQIPYIVMELLEGVPLGAYTQNGGRVPIAQAVPILQGILAGLAAAHGQGVVHRDLKPDNVFLTRHASGAFVVKVLDFGIAKVMDVAGGMGSRTRSGMLLGTAAYMSPEQVKNASNVDQRADLWSAGVMLYEMLTGRVAFPAPTEYARLAAVLSSEPEPVERIDPSLAVIAPCLARALKKDREQRYGSAVEMSRALAAVSPGDSARDGARAGGLPPSGALPLSRLPEVPSVFAPTVRPAPQAPSALAQTSPAPVDSPAPARQKPGSTLASAGEASPVLEAPPQVAVLAHALDGTLPSKDLPILADHSDDARPRLRAMTWVLVAGALALGFVLGWFFARMH